MSNVKECWQCFKVEKTSKINILRGQTCYFHHYKVILDCFNCFEAPCHFPWRKNCLFFGFSLSPPWNKQPRGKMGVPSFGDKNHLRNKCLELYVNVFLFFGSLSLSVHLFFVTLFPPVNFASAIFLPSNFVFCWKKAMYRKWHLLTCFAFWQKNI